MDKILVGDCLAQMNQIEEGTVDLVYIDPPFFTQRTHQLKNRPRTKEFRFADSWDSVSEYSEFLRVRLLKMQGLLKETGSIFVHCDKSCEHIIRNVLNDVFGAKCFQSEIIWAYKRWSNSKKGLLPGHQNIYFYSKGTQFKFKTIFTAYSETTNIDQILQRRTRDQHNKSIYDFDSDGNAKHGATKKGVPLSDVWNIPYLNPKAKERVGYPTQKPLLLLERIISLVTDEGDLVVDPFCGSGTTCVAANLLNRKYVGIDVSEEAVALTQNRIDSPVRTESRLLTRGRESYENADKAALSLLQGIAFNPVQRNKGIDAILVEQFENAPILVRVQKRDEPIEQAASLLAKAMRSKRSKRAFLIQTSQFHGLFDTLPNYDGMEILQAPAVLMVEAARSGYSSCNR